VHDGTIERIVLFILLFYEIKSRIEKLGCPSNGKPKLFLSFLLILFVCLGEGEVA